MKTVWIDAGTELAALGLGTWMVGRDPARAKAEETALLTGIDLGMTVVDTAELYANESFLGRVIESANVRNRVFLTSKVHPQNADFRGTLEACERSLRRLRTDHLDLYLLHWIGPHTFSETVAAMERLLQDGKILRWGVSNLDVQDMEQIVRLDAAGHCCCNQVLYSLAARGVEYDLIGWHAAHAMLTVAYSPLAEGRLAQDPLLSQIGRRHRASASQVALAWTLRCGRVMAIPKAADAAHVRANARAADLVLSPEDIAAIDARFPPPKEKVPLAGW